MNNQYDVVIVGAGVSGLFAGNFLAKKGAKVLICEQHVTPGGYACGFQRKGYYFDGGLQSFGSYGMVFPLLRELGILDQFDFKPSRVRMVAPGLDLTIQSLPDVRDAFKKLYPEAAAALDGFFTELAELVKAVGLFAGEPAISLQNGLGKFRSIAGLMLDSENRTLMKKMGEWNKLKYPEFIAKHLSGFPEVCQFLTQLCYENAPLIAYAGMWRGYLDDYWYPQNGMQGFANQLAWHFNELGGEIRYGSRVRSIVCDHGVARGVILENGESIGARTVLSAGDYRRLITELVDDEKAISPELRADCGSTPVSASFATLFLGLKRPVSEMNTVLQAHHVFYYPSIKREGPADDASYFKGCGLGIISPTFENSELSDNGKASLVVQTFAPYEWMNYWGTGEERRRGPEYQRLKAQAGEDMLGSLEQFLPGVREQIEVMEIATPLTMERYTLNSGGASAGWSWDPEKTLFKNNKISINTPVRNLLTCGHWTTSPAGIPAAALSGKLAADRVR